MNLLDSNYDESEGGSPVTLLQNNKVNTFAGGRGGRVNSLDIFTWFLHISINSRWRPGAPGSQRCGTALLTAPPRPRSLEGMTTAGEASATGMMALRRIRKWKRSPEFGCLWSPARTAGRWGSWPTPCSPAAIRGLKHPATATRTWNIRNGLTGQKDRLTNSMCGRSLRATAQTEQNLERTITRPQRHSSRVSPRWPAPSSSRCSTRGPGTADDPRTGWVTSEGTGWWRRRGFDWRRRGRRAEGREPSGTWRRGRGGENDEDMCDLVSEPWTHNWSPLCYIKDMWRFNSLNLINIYLVFSVFYWD